MVKAHRDCFTTSVAEKLQWLKQTTWEGEPGRQALVRRPVAQVSDLRARRGRTDCGWNNPAARRGGARTPANQAQSRGCLNCHKSAWEAAGLARSTAVPRALATGKLSFNATIAGIVQLARKWGGVSVRRQCQWGRGVARGTWNVEGGTWGAEGR